MFRSLCLDAEISSALHGLWCLGWNIVGFKHMVFKVTTILASMAQVQRMAQTDSFSILINIINVVITVEHT